MKTLLTICFTILLAVPAVAATRAYHLELEAQPATPFPYLSKFGSVTLHVFPGGVRAETLWLNGFSKAGTKSVTVENPLGRMYTDVPIGEIGSLLKKLSGGRDPVVGTVTMATMKGKVGTHDATRYRLIYGPESWIDVWTTNEIPDNAHFRALILEMARGISPATATLARTIPGVPIHVELNFQRFKKVPLLRLKKLTFENSEEEEALKVGKLYMRAPLLESLWK